MPIWSFLGYDVLGASIWVPTMLLVGHRFGNRFGNLADLIGHWNQTAAWTMGVAVALLMLRVCWGREESKL